MLDEANNLHSNIKLVRQVVTNVSFLDVFIENNNGILATSVYRKEVTEPYIVPFKSDYPRHVFTNIIDGALLRAVRYLSGLSAFDKERRSIKRMLFYNGYPLKYIYSRFINCFINNLSIKSLIPLIENENHFMFVCGYLLYKPMITEHQIASRIAKIIDPNSKDIVDNPLVQARLRKESKPINNLIIHYTHEKRLES